MQSIICSLLAPYPSHPCRSTGLVHVASGQVAACLGHCRSVAKALLQRHDACNNKASMGASWLLKISRKACNLSSDCCWLLVQFACPAAWGFQQVITFRFLSERGPFRQHWEAWALGQVDAMHPPMLDELLAYATSLVVMQRLESRHSILQRRLARRHNQLPDTLSATLRRLQNRDIERPDFQERLPEFLAAIPELYQGEPGPNPIHELILTFTYPILIHSFFV